MTAGAREVCDWLLPRHDANLTPDRNFIIGCLRDAGHDGEHHSRLTDGRLINWLPDDCGGECLEEYCECFSWSEVLPEATQ